MCNIKKPDVTPHVTHKNPFTARDWGANVTQCYCNIQNIGEMKNIFGKYVFAKKSVTCNIFVTQKPWNLLLTTCLHVKRKCNIWCNTVLQCYTLCYTLYSSFLHKQTNGD